MSFVHYIAEGFMEDCEQLIHTLTETYVKVDWHKFCHYWKEMQFDILFYGRQTVAEVVEFTEELLQTARLYIITETDNFEDQVIGIFIAYAIIIIQPYKNLCALRLVPSDVACLKKIEAKARMDDRRDVLMILAKLYTYGNTQCHVSLRERAMDITIRKYFDGSTRVPQCIARRWHGRLDRQTVNSFENIAQMESKYMELKKKAKLAAEVAYPGTKVQIDIFKPEGKHMAASLRQLVSGPTKRETQDDEETYISSVKRKAMKNTVDPMRHLHGLSERKKDNLLKSPTKKNVRNQCRKLSSPPKEEKALQGYSLPDLNDNLYDDPDDPKDVNNDQMHSKRQASPEPPFKGFTTQDIQLNNSMELNELEPTKSQTSNKSFNKQGLEKSSNVKPADKTKLSASSSNNKHSPKCNETKRTISKKRKISDKNPESKNKKINFKTKFNKKRRLSNDINSGDSSTLSSDNTSDTSDAKEINKHAKSVNKKDDTQACQGKEYIVQSRGVIKHFVDFEINDLVIRTEKDAPVKDIEIEYIDNYTGTNALYEELCEVSDDDESKKDKKKVESIDPNKLSINNAVSNDEVQVIEDDEKDNDDGNIEVFQIIEEDKNEPTQSTKVKTKVENPSKNTMISTRSVEELLKEDAKVAETVKKVLSKNTTKFTDRRNLKQPNLRSKLKKMGLLPVANFEDDSN